MIPAVSEQEIAPRPVGDRNDPSVLICDIGVIAMTVCDLYQPSGSIEQRGLVPQRQSQLHGVIDHLPAVRVLVKAVALRTAAAAYPSAALPEISLFPVFADIDISGVSPSLMPESRRNHALHHAEPEAVSDLHRGKIRSPEHYLIVGGILMPSERTVVEMLHRHRHTVARPRKILRFKHQVPAPQIHIPTTESAELMAVHPRRRVNTVSRRIRDDKLRRVFPAVTASVKNGTASAS